MDEVTIFSGILVAQLPRGGTALWSEGERNETKLINKMAGLALHGTPYMQTDAY